MLTSSSVLCSVHMKMFGSWELVVQEKQGESTDSETWGDAAGRLVQTDLSIGTAGSARDESWGTGKNHLHTRPEKPARLEERVFWERT